MLGDRTAPVYISPLFGSSKSLLLLKLIESENQIVVLLPEILRFVGMPDNLAANMRMIIYGLTLIILMRYRPQGIAGEYKFSK